MLAAISFIVLCLAFVAGPLIVLIGGAHIIRADDLYQEAFLPSKKEARP